MTQTAQVEHDTEPDAWLRRVPLIPGATALGHVARFRDQRQRLALLKAAVTTGPVSRMRFFSRSLLVVSSPDAARQVLVEQASAFEKSPAQRLLLRPFAGDGLFTSEGELWKSQRKLMSPLFHASQLASYVPAMNDVTRHAAAQLRDGESFDLARLMTRITMGIVGATLFGTETFAAADELGAALTTALKWVDDNVASGFLTLQMSVIHAADELGPRVPAVLDDIKERIQRALRDPILLPGSHDAQLCAAIGVLDTYITKMIAARRGDPSLDERGDLLTKLLLARDAEPGALSSQGMSDDQVRDEAMTLFIAGHETTANALAWAFYLLSRNPEARARVQAEADALPAQGVTVFEPARLAYTTRVFKEALRLYPPIILLGRRSLEPFTLADGPYPEDVLLVVNPYGIHHSADVWPDPERFDPDRFLPEREAERHKAAWIPFGVGPRVCIGNSFALIEGPLVLATLMRTLTFDINPRRSIEPDSFATLRPKGGVPARVRRR